MTNKNVLVFFGLAACAVGAVLAVITAPHLGPRVTAYVKPAVWLLAVISFGTMLFGLARANSRNRRSPRL